MIPHPSIKSPSEMTPALPFCIAALVVPLLGLFSAAAITPAFLVACVGALAAYGWKLAWRPPVGTMVIVSLGIGWALLSSLWSVAGMGKALLTVASVSAVAVVGVVGLKVADGLTEAERARVRSCLVAGTVLGAVVLLIEVWAGYPLTSSRGPLSDDQAAAALSRGAVVLMLLLWAAIHALARWWGIVVWLLAAAAVLSLGKHALVLGFVAGSISYALVGWRPRPLLNALRAGVIVLALAPPALIVASPLLDRADWLPLNNSAIHRLVIWDFVVQRIAERPVLGWGMDASRVMPGGGSVIAVSVPTRTGVDEMKSYQVLPLHPHNGILQIWLELGLPGALFVTVFLWSATSRLLSSPHAHAAAAPFVGACVVANLSFGLWQSWWQSSLWLVAVLFVAVISPGRHDGRTIGNTTAGFDRQDLV